MNDTNFIYIAREIYTPSRGLIRIDEEGVFSTFEEANDFLESLRSEDEYIDEPTTDDKYLKHEIVRFRLNDYENRNHEIRWTYKLNGELISKEDAKEETPETFELVFFKSLFKLGEIVRIKPKNEESESFFIRGNYGVIGQVPVPKDSWEKSGKLAKEWDSAYIVWMISQDTSFLYHEHLDEICLDKVKGEIPEDLYFLHLVSDYFQKDGNVDNADKIQAVFTEDIVVRKIKYFFEKGS